MFIGDGDGFVWVIAGMTMARGERGGGGGLEDGLGRVNFSGMKLKSRQLLLCLIVAKSFKMLLFPMLCSARAGEPKEFKRALLHSEH